MASTVLTPDALLRELQWASRMADDAEGAPGVFAHEDARRILGRFRGWSRVQVALAARCRELALAWAAEATLLEDPYTHPRMVSRSERGECMPGPRVRRRHRETDEESIERLASYTWPKEHAEPVRDSDAGILWRWAVRLDQCGELAGIVQDEETGKHACVGRCCEAPTCPRAQRRHVVGLCEKAETLMQRLQSGRRHPDRPEDRRFYSWKLVTISPRNLGQGLERDPRPDIERLLRLRSTIMRRLKDLTDAPVDGWCALEMSPLGHGHLHALVFLPYLAQETVVDGLRDHLAAHTCDVPGCSHEWGPESSCRGSYMVDVRAVAGAAGVREALKYAVAPVGSKHAKERASARSGERDLAGYALPVSEGGHLTEEDATFNLLCLLALWKRHRVESYGLARTAQRTPLPETDDATTTLELALKRPRLVCLLARTPSGVKLYAPRARSGSGARRRLALDDEPPTLDTGQNRSSPQEQLLLLRKQLF